MPTLTWDELGEHFYETGVDHGVLYIPDVDGEYSNGVAWNGLTAVTESPTGAEPTALYADNIKYLNLYSAESFGGTIEAYTYPDEFCQFDGLGVPSPGVTIGQQPRKSFGLSYRTLVGNDLEGNAHGYKLHLLYGLTASPSEKAYATVSESPEAITFSWAVTSIPAPVMGFAPTSLITVDSRTVDGTELAALEEALYGGVSEPYLPTPDEVVAMFPSGGTVVATGATAGIPGTWTPGGSAAPANVAAITSSGVVANPATAWTTGQYVQTATAGVPGQAHWDSTAWVAGVAP